VKLLGSLTGELLKQGWAGSAAALSRDGERTHSVLQEKGAGGEIWEWKFGTTKNLACCYLGKASVPLSLCGD